MGRPGVKPQHAGFLARLSVSHRPKYQSSRFSPNPDSHPHRYLAQSPTSLEGCPASQCPCQDSGAGLNLAPWTQMIGIYKTSEIMFETVVCMRVCVWQSLALIRYSRKAVPQYNEKPLGSTTLCRVQFLVSQP